MKALPAAIRNLIIQRIQEAPQLTYQQIAKELGVCEFSVNKAARLARINRRPGPKPKAVILG